MSDRHLQALRDVGDSLHLIEAHLDVCPDCRRLADEVEPPPNILIGPGTPLGNMYQLTRHLGRGAICDVFVATDPTLQMEVAVKFLQSDMSTRFSDILDFVQQAMQMAHVADSRVVQIRDVCVLEPGGAARRFDWHLARGERPFVVMEYIKDDVSIRERIKSAHLNYADILDFSTQIALGLQVIHTTTLGGVPVVHNDLKPDNILLKEVGGHWEVKINDFGVNDLTYDYAAPEILDARRQRVRRAGTIQSDLYSLGLIMYEMCKGTLPPSRGHDLNKRVDYGAVKPKLLGSPFLHIILALLQPNPGDRFSSVDQVLLALRELPKPGSDSDPPQPPQPPNPWRKRPPLLAAALIAAVLLIALAIVKWNPSVPAGTVASGAVATPTATPTALTLMQSAWMAFEEGKQHHFLKRTTEANAQFAIVEQLTSQIIDKYFVVAEGAQTELQNSNEPRPPSGLVTSEQELAINRREPLNDVAACYWIQGCIAELLNDIDKATALYAQAEQFTYARVYDPVNKSFWPVSEDAAGRRKKLERQRTAK